MNLKPIGVAKDKNDEYATLFMDVHEHMSMTLIARMSKRKDILCLKSVDILGFRPAVRTQYNTVLTDANIGLLPEKNWDMAYFFKNGIVYLELDPTNTKVINLTYVSKKTGSVRAEKVQDVNKCIYRRGQDIEYHTLTNHIQNHHPAFRVEVANTLSEIKSVYDYADALNVQTPQKPRIGAYDSI